MTVNAGPGFFIDIGCSIPTFQSNTRLLLENDWKGVCIDVQARFNDWKPYPNALFLQGDAVKFPWRQMVANGYIPLTVHYASVDVDNGTFDALKNLIDSGIKPNCLTVEHDAYRFKDTLRIPQREFMAEKGYIIARHDVADIKGDCVYPYEDWYVLPGACLDSILEDIRNW